MAIGDQVHWHGNSFNSNLPPSNGVEIILKDVTSTFYNSGGYNYYMQLHWRTSSSQQSELLSIGGNSQYTGHPNGYNRASNASKEYNPNMASSPVNQYNYLRSAGYGSGYYHVAGYITKD